MTAIFGDSVDELAMVVANTPLDEHRQCANCVKTGCNRVISTGAPNTAFSSAAALTCGSEVCRDKVRENMQMMASVATDLDAESAENSALDSALPADAFSDAAGRAWRQTKTAVTNSTFWKQTMPHVTSKLSSSMLTVLSDMKDRPIVQEMVKKITSDKGLRSLLDKKGLQKAATLILPSRATLEKVVNKAGGMITEELVEKVLTSVMAATSRALPLESLGSKRSQLKVADINSVTRTGITLRADQSGGIRVRLPALAAMAGLKEDTLWRIGEVVDASNGRVMVLEPETS